MSFIRRKDVGSRAFSLIEVLIVLVVIGILFFAASISTRDLQVAEERSKDQRNAQQLASVCNAAQAAGHDFVKKGLDLSATVAEVVKGAVVKDEDSPFFNTFFGVPNLSLPEQEAASRFLEIRNGMLVFVPEEE